jgi:hypothetical protein
MGKGSNAHTACRERARSFAVEKSIALLLNAANRRLYSFVDRLIGPRRLPPADIGLSTSYQR